jgi:hypothetical protein
MHLEPASVDPITVCKPPLFLLHHTWGVRACVIYLKISINFYSLHTILEAGCKTPCLAKWQAAAAQFLGS